MKNLKKFLIALAVVALLVSLVAVVVSAVTYTGSLTELDALYEAYVAETKLSKTTLAKQTAKLAKVYDYVAKSPVDPDEQPAEGGRTYAEIMALVDAAAVSIGNGYIESADSATGAVAITEIVSLYDHLGRCVPVDKDTEGYAELLVEAENANVRAILKFAEGIKSMEDKTKLLSSVVTLADHIEAYPPSAEAVNADAVESAFAEANAFAVCEYLATTETNVNGASIIAIVNIIFDHVAEYPLDESIDGVAEFPANIERANMKGIQLYHQSAKDLAPKAAMDVYLTITTQLEEHPVVSTDNTEYKDILTDVSRGAADAARARYEQVISTPADHVDANDDKVCDADVCAADMSDESKLVGNFTHVIGRYNGIRVIQNYLKTVDVSAEQIPNGSSSIKQLVNAYVTETANEMEERRKNLDSQADFDEYDLTEYHIVKDYNGDSDNDVDKLFQAYNTTANCYTERGVDLYGNGYQKLLYGGVASHLYLEPNFGMNFQNGLVIEFDIIVNDSFYIQKFETREPSTGTSKMYKIFELRSSGRDGVITLTNTTSRGLVKNVSAKGIVVPNVWSRFTMTYNNETRLGKLYVNYEYVMDIEYSEGWDFQAFRIGDSTTDQEVGYDNFNIFNGTAYRDFNKFEIMSDREKFEFYVDFMLEPTNNNLSRNSAYQKAKALAENYPADDPYVIKFTSCDYDNDIKKPAMAENISILAGMVDELRQMTITSETVNAVNMAIADIDSFVKLNSELINKGDTSVGGYQDQMAIMNEVRANLLLSENVVAFTNAVSKFQRATSYVAMAKHAASAKAIFDLAGYADPDNVAFVSDDPAIVNFESALNGIEKPAADADPEDEKVQAAIEAWNNRVTLFQYYESFAAIMAERSDYENSKRILNCVDLITSLDGYEDTYEFWSANEEYIANYAGIIRTILNNGNYDPEVEGLDEALAKYDVINVYFYEHLQKQHIAAITEQLAKYTASNSYIIKEGVVNYVTQYIEENDLAYYVDTEGNEYYNTAITDAVADAIKDEIEQLKSVMVTYDVYREELAIQKDDYSIILEENTTYFINTVAYMGTVITYAELKPLFETATTYYHSMDVESAEASAAVDKYNDYRIMLNSLEANGAIFVGYAAKLAEAEELEGVEKQDAIFAALVNCMTYVELTDIGVEGVAEAYEAYEEALAAYNAEYADVVEDVSESSKVVCAVRSDYMATTVLAILGKIFEI